MSPSVTPGKTVQFSVSPLPYVYNRIWSALVGQGLQRCMSKYYACSFDTGVSNPYSEVRAKRVNTNIRWIELCWAASTTCRIHLCSQCIQIFCSFSTFAHFPNLSGSRALFHLFYFLKWSRGVYAAKQFLQNYNAIPLIWKFAGPWCQEVTFILINYFQDQHSVIFFPRQSEAKGIQWKKQNCTVNICCYK